MAEQSARLFFYEHETANSFHKLLTENISQRNELSFIDVFVGPSTQEIMSLCPLASTKSAEDFPRLKTFIFLKSIIFLVRN